MIEENYQDVKKHENNLEKILKFVLKKKCEPKQLLNLLRFRIELGHT